MVKVKVGTMDKVAVGRNRVMEKRETVAYRGTGRCMCVSEIGRTTEIG